MVHRAELSVGRSRAERRCANFTYKHRPGTSANTLGFPAERTIVLAAAAIEAIPGFYEPFSSLSHLLGAGLFAVLGVILVRRGRGDVSRVACLSIYAFAAVFLFSMSGVYHLLPRGSGGRAVLARLDHSAIFVLIVGTFTATHGMVFRGLARWLPLFFMWAAAIMGITLKLIYFQDVPEWLGLTLYLSLGWAGAISAAVLCHRHGLHFIRFMLWGAMAYTLGGIFEYLRWSTLVPGIIGPHEIFHVAVLLGTASFWVFAYQLADGHVPPARSRLVRGAHGRWGDCAPKATTHGLAASAIDL
jgi:hemolysin III